MMGPDSFVPFVRNFRSSIPNIHIAMSRFVCEGDHCAVFCDVRGTNTGRGLGFAATHRDIHFTGSVIARVENGQIQEAWNSFDFLTFYQQLGLVAQIE